LIRTLTCLVFATIFDQPALAQPSTSPEFRMKAWHEYRARCAKGPSRQLFDFEIGQFVPNLVRRKATLNYKSFCECRHDEMNKALVSNLASHLTTLDCTSMQATDRQQFEAANKSVFEKSSWRSRAPMSLP